MESQLNIKNLEKATLVANHNRTAQDFMNSLSLADKNKLQAQANLDLENAKFSKALADKEAEIADLQAKIDEANG